MAWIQQHHQNPTIVWAMTPGAPHITCRQVKGQSFLPTVLILRMVCVSLASFKNFLRLMNYFVRCLSFLDFLNLNLSLSDEMLNSEDAIMWPNGLPLTVVMWLKAWTLCLIMSFTHFTSLGEACFHHILLWTFPKLYSAILLNFNFLFKVSIVIIIFLFY